MKFIKKPELNDECSKYFRYQDIFECSDTFKKSPAENIPKQIETYKAIETLSKSILDKVMDKFGNLELTYGFCGSQLQKKIKRNIFPKTDQHAGYERNNKGMIICDRGGFAVDFYVKNVSSLQVARWIVENCSFDRLYYYGNSRPIHVSLTESPSSQVVLMKFKTVRTVPSKIKIRNFLEEDIGY